MISKIRSVFLKVGSVIYAPVVLPLYLPIAMMIVIIGGVISNLYVACKYEKCVLTQLSHQCPEDLSSALEGCEDSMIGLDKELRRSQYTIVKCREDMENIVAACRTGEHE